MLLRRALIRAGFADHRLLTLSMAYVALAARAQNFCANSQTARKPAFHGVVVVHVGPK
jgi:hypothetical protein